MHWMPAAAECTGCSAMQCRACIDKPNGCPKYGSGQQPTHNNAGRIPVLHIMRGACMGACMHKSHRIHQKPNAECILSMLQAL